MNLGVEFLGWGSSFYLAVALVIMEFIREAFF